MAVAVIEIALALGKMAIEVGVAVIEIAFVVATICEPVMITTGEVIPAWSLRKVTAIPVYHRVVAHSTNMAHWTASAAHVANTSTFPSAAHVASTSTFPSAAHVTPTTPASTSAASPSTSTSPSATFRNEG
jgi:hypothetical protein